MGKRKSKTQKQKQVKASQKLAKAFAKKLGVETSTGGVVVATPSNHNNNNNPNHDSHAAVTTTKKPIISSKKLLAKLSKKKKRRQEQETTTVPICDDFVLEAKSLRERELQIEWKRNVIRQTRRRQQQPQGKTASLKFSPSSFSLAVGSSKSVEQLAGKVSNVNLQESTLQNLFPSSSASWNTTTAASSLRVMTPTKPQPPVLPTPFSTPKSQWNDDEEEDNNENHNNKNNRGMKNHNPWSVLDEDDDLNHSGTSSSRHGPPTTTTWNPQANRTTAIFQFAPPSFVVPDTTTTTTTTESTPPLPPPLFSASSVSFTQPNALSAFHPASSSSSSTAVLDPDL